MVGHLLPLKTRLAPNVHSRSPLSHTDNPYRPCSKRVIPKQTQNRPRRLPAPPVLEDDALDASAAAVGVSSFRADNEGECVNTFCVHARDVKGASLVWPWCIAPKRRHCYPQHRHISPLHTQRIALLNHSSPPPTQVLVLVKCLEGSGCIAPSC